MGAFVQAYFGSYFLIQVQCCHTFPRIFQDNGDHTFPWTSVDTCAY